MIVPNRYREQYARWLPAALPLLEAENYAEALKDFPKPERRAHAFRRAGPPTRLALVTSSGAYDSTTQAPFVESSAVGDVTHRVLPADAPNADIGFRHGHYDPAAANADREVLLPRAALAAAGATLTPHIVSYMGYCIDWPTFIEQTLPAMVKVVVNDRADGALLVPV